MTASAIASVRSALKEHLAPKGNVTETLCEWISKRAPYRFEPFYSSFDIRDAGFKLAPVDGNLYPAGFNNICSDDLEASPEIVKPLLKKHLGATPKRIAILPEAHTKNKYYADNLYELRQIFRRIGIEAEVGWLSTEGQHEKGQPKVELTTSDGRIVEAFPFWREGSRLVFAPFEPEFILINNDFSSGFPEILADLTQPIEPSPRMGWHTRRKSDFFHHYNRLANELANAAGIDPWHVQVATKLVEQVDFDENAGMDRIAAAVDQTIEELRREYSRRNINEQPFVFVKNNAGTYGMGILRVESGAELLALNRRERNKMAVGKNHLMVHDVIVQEGIPTRFQVDGVYSEPVIYMMGHELLGGFLRKNPNRGKVDNLNSKGMVFQKLCLSDLRHGADRDLELELVYGTIARLSAAAISLEIANIESKQAEQKHSAEPSVTL